MNPFDQATIDPRSRRAHTAPAAPQLRLTLLAHVDLSRVGHHARLEPTPTQAVARLHPEFSDGAPLLDPFVSRSPVVLGQDSAGGVIVDVRGTRTAVVLDGQPVSGTATVAVDRLDEGVVVELGTQVVALLHLHRTGDDRGRASFGLIGPSDGLARVRREIALVADLDVPVLIRGESGVGKELVARAVHRSSTRRDARWVSVNMAAVPANLAASTLFGHARGAFSGAVADHRGHFVEAHGGTLFLDEVGDTPPEVQVTLLRALETGEVQPVGARRPTTVDVRLISATDADLEGRDDFRGPLLHRLAGFQLFVPPLRARRADIGMLFVHFAEAEAEAIGVAEHLRRVEVRRPWLPAGLMGALARYGWPGNVRQLRNVTRQLMILHRDRPSLDQWATHLPRLLGAASEARAVTTSPVAPPAAPAPTPTPTPRKRYRHVDDISDDELVGALRAHAFALKATAAALGVSRTALYGRVERCPLVRPATALTAAEIEAAASTHPDLKARAAALEVSPQALKRRMTALGLR